jgi:hypothetical protein
MQPSSHRLVPGPATPRATPAGQRLKVQQRMPQALDVAAPAHHLVPEAHEGLSEARVPLACPVTGRICPALAPLFSTLQPTSEAARGWLGSLAPCDLCRVECEARRDALRHLRLGQREREILTATAEAGTLIVTEPGMTRSTSASRRRAALSLTKAGLVASVASPEKASGPARAAVTLTGLGRYVMAAYGRYITTGKPVRWTRPLKGVPLPGQDPAWLSGAAFARTEAALRDTLTELKGVLIAAIGGRIKDPDRLDAVTRHLEEKATLLKAALEPARSSGR